MIKSGKFYSVQHLYQSQVSAYFIVKREYLKRNISILMEVVYDASASKMFSCHFRSFGGLEIVLVGIVLISDGPFRYVSGRAKL